MIAKLARGTARLAFWRKPIEASPAAAAPAAASASIAPLTADAPKPSWFARLKQKLRRDKDPAALASVAASVLAEVATPVVTAGTTPAPPPGEAPPLPPPPLVPQALEEMLELSDPVAPSAHADLLFGDDTPEDEIQALGSSEDAQANPVAADSFAADMDAPELEPEPEETADLAQDETAQAEIVQPETVQAEAPVAGVSQPEAAAAEGDEPHKPKRVSRLLGILSKKWVWIPSVSVAMLAVIGTMSFMLMQSKQATHELQAELANAKKQLKQAPIKPEVAPPVLVAHQDVTPHQTEPVDPAAEIVAHAEPAPQAELHPAAHPEPAPPPPTPVAPLVALASPAPSARANVVMDCDISDKASVAKNLKSCIEAFNQATAR